MTGFTTWLRRFFCLPESHATWASRSRNSLLVPVRIKVRIRNKRQIEFKVEYLVQPGLKEQTYDVRLFLFFPAELDAASTTFFPSLFEIVRLHTPTVDPCELAQADGVALSGIRAALAALKHDVASGKDVAAGQKRVVYQLQLLGCTFRRALRKSGKRIISRLSGAADGNPSEVEERCAAASICDLLEATDAAILTVQKVCGACDAGSASRWQQEAWRLVEEQMLLEARITLLKLASRLDAIYAEAAWPVACEASPAATVQDGRSLDRVALQHLRVLLAGEPSRDSSAQPDIRDNVQAALSGTSAERASASDGSGVSAEQPDASASPGLHMSAGTEQDWQAACKSSSGTAGLKGAEAQRGNGPEQRDMEQGAEWQLSSISQKTLHGGRSRSSSLEWIHPRMLLRRLSMLGSTSAQQRGESTHLQPEARNGAATSAPASTAEQPDLELGLLPHHNTDSASLLHSTASDTEAPRPGSRGMTEHHLSRHPGKELLSAARMLALQQTERLEAMSEERDYCESLLHEAAELQNEHYTDRVKVLKRHSRLAVTLAPKATARSMVADDIVGMSIAGLAMCFALVTIWLAQKNSPYGVVYLAIYVAGYILKDRIKEWGKRYLAPMLEWFGIEFPDRVVKFRDYFGTVVGRCREKVRMKEGLDCDARVLSMRYSSQDWVPESKDQVIKPERVLVLSKSMCVRWRLLEAGLQGVKSLDDIMRIDLHYLSRGMQSSVEQHLAAKRDSEGCLSVQDVECARVYHVNTVMEIRTQGTKGPGKSMQLQKTRIILDDEGIRRLEPGGHDNLLRQKHGRFPHAAGALRKMRFRSSMEAPLTAG